MGGGDEMADDLRRRVGASAFHRGLGIEVLDASEGSVRLGSTAREEHLNLQGLVHGGLLATLADTAMGLAIRTAVGPGRAHVTVELQVRYLRPARPGELVAVGRAVRVGRSIAFAEGELTDGEGRELVRASATYAVGPLGD